MTFHKPVFLSIGNLIVVMMIKSQGRHNFLFYSQGFSRQHRKALEGRHQTDLE